MNTLRSVTLVLVLVLAASALAAPYEFMFHQGPDQMVIPVNDFRQFHSAIVNNGDNAEAYTLTVTADDPDNWLFGVCYGGICYPPTITEFRVPETGTLMPGEEMEFEFDVTSISDTGSASYTITLACESNPSFTQTFTYSAQTPVSGRALIFSVGENVKEAGVNEYIQFHPIVYNAGDVDDAYTMTLTRDLPDNWLGSFCVGGICYPPFQDSIELPVGGGVYGAADAEPIDIDFSTITDEGTGIINVTITSVNDPSVTATGTFTVSTYNIIGVGDTPVSSLLTDLSVSPNPFNPRADIRFALGGELAHDVTVDIFDSRGRQVRSLRAGQMSPGQQSVTWDGMNDAGQPMATGVYMARISAGGAQQTVKMSLVK